jgi:ABC-2 type transport system permease protein
MKWLIRRELWEHKGAFVYAPLVVAAALVLLLGGGFLYAMATTGAFHLQANGQQVITIEGVPPEMYAKAASIAASSYLAITAPLFLVLPVVAFFYCLAALHDDRRDRSILFWKSLPLSDRDTVLSKVIVALLVAPLVVIGVGIVASLLLLALGLMAAAANNINLFVPVLSDYRLYLSPLYLLAFLPLYILWALPTVGWLLLVSSWARSKVFLWAVGLPLVALAVLSWFDFVVGRFSGVSLHAKWFGEEVVARFLGGLMPGIWFGELETETMRQMQGGLDAGMLLRLSYSTLASPAVWAAAIAGCAMIFGAMRLRRWRDEG